MYDAVDAPYTYEGSTVLINKLDLRNQKDLDAFALEISTQRAAEELPGGDLDFEHYCAIHHHLFQDVYDGPACRERCVYPSRAIRSAFPKISKHGQLGCFRI